MATIDGLDSTLRALNRQVEAAHRDNLRIQAQVDQLDDAIERVKRAKRAAGDLLSAAKDVKIPEKWKGYDRNVFENNLEGTWEHIKDYQGKIGDLLKKMEAKRRNLWWKQNLFAEMVVGLEKKIESTNKQRMEEEALACTVGGSGGGGGGVR